MALYSRDSPQESRAADKVLVLISGHPNGVTFIDLIHRHRDEISDWSSVLAAIDLLREEGKVITDEPWQGRGYLETVRLYANPVMRLSR